MTPAGTAKFILRRKRSDRSTEGETTGSSRARGKRPPWNGNQLYIKKTEVIDLRTLYENN